MTRLVRFVLVAAAVLALCGVGMYAQATGAGQKPPDAQARPDAQAQAKDAQAKPDAKAPELTAEQKAFNAIADEKDAQKRVPLYEKFIADYPKSETLVSLARGEINRATLAALKASGTKFLEVMKAEIETAKKSDNPTELASTYAGFAVDLLNAGVMLGEAEEYARQGLSLLDEQKYIDFQKDLDKKAADAFAKRAANPQTAGRGGGISFRSVNGAPTVQPVPPRPPSASTTPSRPATPPRARTDEELRTTFKSMRASNLATLGRVLMKRERTAEGEKVLKEAFAANPPASTKSLVARALCESAKKAGNDADQMEYLTVLALSGQITAAEQKDLEALYRKSHDGSLDDLDAMLDARYAKENPRFPVTPANRKAAPNQRVVLAENFTGSG